MDGVTMSTPEEAYASAVAMAQARLDQAKAEAAEEAKWAAKRKVKVTAVKRHSSDPNSKKFSHYVVAGHGNLAHGDSVVLELTEREIHNMKLDPFVSVDESNLDVEKKAESVVDAPKEGVAPPEGVSAPVVEALEELKHTKKKGKY